MKRSAALLLLALLAAPPSAGFHGDDPLVPTDVVPVDRAQRQVLDLVDEVVETGFDRLQETVDPVLDMVPEQTIVLYRDGTGADAENADPATGVLGQWRKLGNDAWRADQVAARNGDWGFQSANPGGGSYALDATGVFLTPELDLRTGLDLSTLGQSDSPATVPPAADPTGQAEGANQGAWDTVRQPFYNLTFAFRHNLGSTGVTGGVLQGRDGVDVWVLTQAGRDRIVANPFGLPTCPPTQCQKVALSEYNGVNPASTGSSVEALGNGPGFTGSRSQWDQATIDLSDWGDSRVWVAFRFASRPEPVPNYFSRALYFDTSVPWRGFHLDDLELRGPAPVANIQVHELDAPLPGTPTIDQSEPIVVQGHVRNTGRTAMRTLVRVEIQDRDTGALLIPYFDVRNVLLQPGAAHRIDLEFPPLAENASLRAVVTASQPLCRQDTLPDGADECNMVTSNSLDTNTGDDDQTRPFNVLRERDVRIVGLTREKPYVERGESLNFTATLENRGTIPETVTVLATLRDVRNGYAAADDLLNADDLSRTYEVPPGESVPLKWSIRTERLGQYQLYVRTSDMRLFDLSMVVRDTRDEFAVPYDAGTITPDGSLAEGAWMSASQETMDFVDEDGAVRSVQARFVHDGTLLHMAFTVPDATEDDAQTGNEDSLALFFDDLGDARLRHGHEDGVRFGNDTGIDQVAEDLAYDADVRWFVPEEDPVGDIDGDVGRSYSPGSDSYTYEIRRPIWATSKGLEVTPGGELGLFAEILDLVPGPQPNDEPTLAAYSFPTGAVRFDGHGQNGEDGFLDDEAATWQRLLLARTPGMPRPIGSCEDAAGQSGPEGWEECVGDGFGIGMGPPLPLLFEPERECKGGLLPAAWIPTGGETIGRPGVSGVDQWNCGLYGPEGRVLLYEGMRPGSTCFGGPCLPFSSAITESEFGNRRGSNTRDAVLTTGEIVVPDVPEPALILQHQFATEVRFNDATVPEDGSSPEGSVMEVRGIAWVTAQVKMGTQWGDGQTVGASIYLVPETGYSTEENTLPFDPNNGAGRGFLRRGSAGFTNHVFCASNLVPPPGVERPANCGWWSPAGHRQGFRPPDDLYPVGGEFHGSPWRVDRIPLHGTAPDQVDGHGTESAGQHSVDLAGETVRLRFHLARDGDIRVESLDPSRDPLLSYGWRISGLAVAESTSMVFDAAAEDLRLRSTSFDPEAIGLGPGTDVPLAIDVVNQGELAVPGTALVLFEGLDVNRTDPDHDGCRNLCEQASGTDPFEPDSDGDGILDGSEAAAVKPDCTDPSAEGDEDQDCLEDEWEEEHFGDLRSMDGQGWSILCSGAQAVGTPLASGERATVAFECSLPEASDGALAVLSATVQTEAGDDLPLNDRSSLPGLRVQSAPDAVLRVDVTPTTASTGFARAVRIEVENLGNVPLGDFTIQQSMTRSGLPVKDDIWAFSGGVPVGESRILSDLRLEASPDYEVADRFLTPTQPGDYALNVRLVHEDGDDDPSSNVVQVPFSARDTLYSNNFETPPVATGVVQGELDFDADVWRPAADPLESGQVLRAGDASGELPASLDDSLFLPRLDLTGARAATLLLRHDYAFEEGYDGARVELSADDGLTWEVLEPRPGAGGYSDRPIVGEAAAALGGDSARAFTGTSSNDALPEDHPARPRVVSEFDLGKAKALQDRMRFVEYGLQDLAGRPASSFIQDGDRYFTGTGWAEEGHPPFEGWLVENVTHNDPKPHSGSRMWWSGSQGNFTPQHVGRVDTALRFDLDLTGSRGASETAILSWSDWRAGWKDRELMGDREGTGGLFEVYVETGPAPADRSGPLLQGLVEAEDGGWSRREVDLGPFMGEEVTVELRYSSLYTSRQDDGQTKNNEGWFLDDLEATRYLLSGGLRTAPLEAMALQTLDGPGFVSRDCEPVGPFTVERGGDLGPNEDQVSESCWSLVSRGAERDGGWHLDEVPGPGGDPARAWRMSSDEAQGYPHQANARLITPPVDLTQVVGDAASLQFDHRFQFESELRSGGLRVPGDAGVVEVQVYDEAMGTYGPWRQLADGPLPDRLVVEGDSRKDQVLGVLSEEDFEGTRYTAIFERGVTRLESIGTSEDILGVGSPFDPMPGICVGCLDAANGANTMEHPLTPAFSGDSGGWRHEEWDISQFIGRKVRFAFHAWTNPQDATQGVPLEGWTVTGVAVDGIIFQGAPVLVRLHTATDDSLLDGHWDVSQVQVAGSMLARKVGLEGPSTQQTFDIPLADPADLPVEVVNRGTSSRQGLALGVTARLPSGLPVTAEIEGADLPPLDDGDVAVSGVDQAWELPGLTPVGTTGGRVPLAVRLLDAPPGEPVDVTVRILEDRGEDVEEDGTLVHVPAYGVPLDDSAGKTTLGWTVRRIDAAEPALRPVGDGGALVWIDPKGSGRADLQALLANEGTTASPITVDWKVYSGGTLLWPATQQFTVQPGEERPLAVTANNLVPGMLRLELTLSSAGVAPTTTVVEFPYEASLVLWDEPFDHGAPLPDNWENHPTGNGAAAFRVEPAHSVLVWGVSPDETGGYCSLMSCGTAVQGIEGIADSAIVDLRQAPNDRGELVVRHAFSFVPDEDGARLEASVLMPGAGGAWVPRTCDSANGGVEWIPLDPTSGQGHTGTTASDPTRNRGNKLPDGTPVFQGTFGSLVQPVTTRYNLTEQETWCTGGSSGIPVGGLGLVGQPVGFRFHVGIQADSAKPRRSGWLVDNAHVESGSLELGPRNMEDGSLEIPLLRNVPKSYPITVTNDSPVTQAVTLSLAEDLPWATLRQASLSLKPGATGTAWLDVRVPEGMPPGKQLVIVDADGDATASAGRPLRDELLVVLDVDPLDKPNLEVELDVENSAAIETGTIVPVFANVTNSGLRPSKAVQVRFEAEDEDGNRQPIETLVVPPLCGALASGCLAEDARAVVAAEWAAPDPGSYTLHVEVDPAERITESVRSDNFATKRVQVKPLQVPDLEVTSLTVAGVGPAGLVEEGQLLEVHAVVTNIGETPMPSSQLRLRANAVTLTEADLPFLAPKASTEVTAFKLASAGTDGRMVLVAVAVGTSALEANVDNNERRQVLTVRRHDLHVQGPEVPVLAMPAEPVSVRLDLMNLGNSLESLQLSVAGAPPSWSARVLPATLAVPPAGKALAELRLLVPADATGGDRTLTVLAKTALLESSANVTVRVASLGLAPRITLSEDAVPTGPSDLTLRFDPSANIAQDILVEPVPGSLWAFDPVPARLEPNRQSEVVVPATTLPGTPAGPAAGALSVRSLDGTWAVRPEFAVEVLPTLRGDLRLVSFEPATPLGDGLRSVDLRFELTNVGNLPFQAHLEPEAAAGTQVAEIDPFTVRPGRTESGEVRVGVEEDLAEAEGLLRFRLVARGMPEAEAAVELPAMGSTADLRLRSVSVPQTVRNGVAHVTFEVENAGTAASPPTVLHAYLDGLLAATAVVPALEPGGLFQGELEVPVPGGDHVLSLVADGRQAVLERHEDNNGRSEALSGEAASTFESIQHSMPSPGLLGAALALLAAALLLRRRRA